MTYKSMRAVLLIITFPALLYALHLPVNIILHLDKRNQDHLETLQPWNYLTLPLQANLSTLTYVIGVFRHGNKPPMDTYDGDKYPYTDERFWPNGESQLTKVGKHQMYMVGGKLRTRYNGYLSTVYKHNEILVKGNPVDRIYMSAAWLLDGLYSPQDDSEHSHGEWQAVPIWEQPHDMSKIAKHPEVCPRFYKMELEIEEIINTFTYQYQEFLDFFNNCTGMEITRLRDVFRYWNMVYFQEQEGYERPEWLKNGHMEVLKNLASSTFTGLLSANQEMMKLISGPLIKEFAMDLHGKIAGKGTSIVDRKMHLEGGHGTTLNGLLPALGFKEPFVPDVGSVFLMELHSSALKGNYIQALYLTNSSEESIQLMEIPECGYECPLNKMLDRMVEVSPANWEKECELSGCRSVRDATLLPFYIFLNCVFTYTLSNY